MSQTRAFLDILRTGEKYGYPKCCVEQFAKDQIAGRSPFELRGWDVSRRYVPCDSCREVPSTIIPQNLLMDIDGTITDDIPNEESHRYADAVPFDGAAKALQALVSEGHSLTYFTSREEKDREVTMKWLEKHGFPCHGLIMNKPRGGNYAWIDNHLVRGIRFLSTKWDEETLATIRKSLQ